MPYGVMREFSEWRINMFYLHVEEKENGFIEVGEQPKLIYKY
jgi:hypothetical protein